MNLAEKLYQLGSVEGIDKELRLFAAMRCLVTSRLGDDVEIPKELL